MSSIDNKFSVALSFLERTKQSESEKKRIIPQSPAELPDGTSNSLIYMPMLTYIMVPFLTIIIMLLLEMTFTAMRCGEAPSEAAKRIMQNTFSYPDVIFLSFSLALTAILDWLTPEGRNGIVEILLRVEIGLCALALVIYAIEMCSVRGFGPSNSVLMSLRGYIHVIFLFVVVIVAEVGYLSKLLVRKK